MTSKQQEKYLNGKCHECRTGSYQLPLNGQQWHLVCNECNTIIMCYEPLPHQQEFHRDTHKYKMFAGGFGSGKTTTGCMETIDHILSTPNGASLIGAETLPQLEQTAMKEFFEVFPNELIHYYNKQKNYIDVTNGHRVNFRPLDDEQKARSLNLSFWWIEEANGVGFSYFKQLQTRLRNTATDDLRGILTTNPDMNWVKTEILLKADKIYNAPVEYPQKKEDINPLISVHIAPTHLNIYLPDDYYENTARGNPDWWIARYLNGSFENREGLVYPMYEEHIVEPFDIPLHWKRRVGGDFGLSNPTAFIHLATDPKTGITYIYNEYKQEQKPVSYHADILNNFLKKIPLNMITDMVGDSAGQQRTGADMSSIFDHYAEYGIYWTPSTKKLDDSIMKMFTYLDLGQLKIFNTCEHFIDEISQYRYPERSLDKEVKNEDIYEKPIAKNDHLLDGCRYVIAEMPDDPSQLINRSYNAQYEITLARTLEDTAIPIELQDNRMSYNTKDAWMGY